MTLAEFIDTNTDELLDDWEAFARTLLPAAEGLVPGDLRDHARDILVGIAEDMRSEQTGAEQEAKAKGHGRRRGMEDAAIRHATGRLHYGFTLDQLAAEYRALRASVMRKWVERAPGDVREIIRFNEAIDESLTSSIRTYGAELSRYRDRFIGILAHDLRNPLSGIVTAAQFLAGSEHLPAGPSRIAGSLLSSGRRLARMVDNLLDLTRSQLGPGMPVARAPMDLRDVLSQVVAENRAREPGRELRIRLDGDLRGEWDADRLSQAVSNLLGNALQHGSATTPVDVAARETGDGVALSVHNAGPAIPRDTLPTIFEPFVRGPAVEEASRSTSLGLGLYIAREIVRAHGGGIDVASSDEEGTTFTVRLPRGGADGARPSAPEAHAPPA